jgi:hypothetical protein
MKQNEREFILKEKKKNYTKIHWKKTDKEKFICCIEPTLNTYT